MNKVFTARDPIEAHFVRDLLERAGIATEIRGEALFGIRSEIGIDSDSLPSIWIADDAKLNEALECVADYERNRV